MCWSGLLLGFYEGDSLRAAFLLAGALPRVLGRRVVLGRRAEGGTRAEGRRAEGGGWFQKVASKE